MRYNVIALHYTKKCDLTCSFCYRGKFVSNERPRSFFIELVKYIKKFTYQVALGGGEPLLDQKFIKEFGEECKKYDLILNVTTNGRIINKIPNSELNSLFKDITLLSISYDKEKWPDGLDSYREIVSRLKQNTNLKIGSNILINKELFDDPMNFINLIDYMFKEVKIDRAYILYPKNYEFVDIVKFKAVYDYLNYKYENFYVDDLTYNILSQGYDDWKSPCQYSKGIISINEKGEVMGCSFDSQSMLTLEKPEDLEKLNSLSIKPRLACPYFKKDELEVKLC